MKNSHREDICIYLKVAYKKPEIYTGLKKASSTNGSGQTGCLSKDECKQIYADHPTQTQLQNGSKTSI